VNSISTTILSELRFHQPSYDVAVEETSQLWSDQLSSIELGNQRRQQLERTIPAEALGARRINFSTPQARFREGYLEIPYDSRKTSEMSNAKLFKRCSTLFDDVQALGRRKCRLFTFDEFNSLSYVESDDSKRFSRQRRTYLPLRSSRYDVYNSRYRLSKFPYFDSLVDYTLRRLLPNDERLA